MLLTDDQKLAGRMFRKQCQDALEASHQDMPPDFIPPPWIKHWRHNCPKRQGRSTSLELKEKYWTSPRIGVCYCSTVAPWTAPEGDFPHEDCQGGRDLTEAGFFAFIFKEGKCGGCGMTARSRAGRLVVAKDRPPLAGRVAR